MNSDSGPHCLCPAGDSAISVIQKPQFGDRKLYRCNACGTVQFYPLPIEEERIDEIYQSENYLGNIREDEYKGYFTFFLNHLRERFGLSKNHRILDFGAGKCYYHKFFKEAGYENISSLEINRMLVNFAQNELDLDSVYHDASQLEPESFDLVLSNQVFEHLINPFDVLQNQILPLVKPGGLVVFAVPNWNSWNRFLLGRRWVGYSPEDHIWFLSPKSVLIHLANVKGIEIEDITVGSSLGKSYDAYSPSGFVKQAYLRLVWRHIENIGKGDQMVVTLRKSGT